MQTTHTNTNTIRIHKVLESNLVDGPGKRTVLYMQGCSIHCAGCQNRHLWDPDAGETVHVDELAKRLLATGQPITISGGEPTDQPTALLSLLVRIRKAAPDAEIILYSGRTLETIVERVQFGRMILKRVDVLVDGPYVQALDNAWMQYRGSANQRVIDVPRTLRNAGRPPVELDWDVPEIVVDGDTAVAATGYARILDGLGDVHLGRRCGQPAFTTGG